MEGCRSNRLDCPASTLRFVFIVWICLPCGSVLPSSFILPHWMNRSATFRFLLAMNAAFTLASKRDATHAALTPESPPESVRELPSWI